MKLVLMLGNGLLCGMLLAGTDCSTNAQISVNAAANMSQAEKRERFMKITGGKIIRPQSGMGCFAFINAQTNAPVSELVRVAALIYRDTKIETKVIACGDKMGAALMKRLGVQLGVSVVAESGAPALVVVPEEGWAVVNVTRLMEGQDGKLMFAKRVRQELYRAFGLLAGGCGSSYEGNLLDPIREPSDLDIYPDSDTAMPFDMLQKIPKFCKAYNVRPWVETSYRRACIDGWAPAPTNDYQRAIWDQVHAAPTKPIVITPESKRNGNN